MQSSSARRLSCSWGCSMLAKCTCLQNNSSGTRISSERWIKTGRHPCAHVGQQSRFMDAIEAYPSSKLRCWFLFQTQVLQALQEAKLSSLPDSFSFLYAVLPSVKSKQALTMFQFGSVLIIQFIPYQLTTGWKDRARFV